MLTIYTKPACPACERVKHYLTTNNIQFETVDITQDANAKQFMIESGYRMVPQIFNDGKIFVEGGAIGLMALTPAQIKNMLTNK